VSPIAQRRRVELVVAGTIVFVAATFTALVLVWRLGYDSAFLTLPPPIETMRDLGAFTLYAWAGLALCGLAVAVSVVACILLALGKGRAALTFVSTTLVGAVLGGTLIIYLPLATMTLDRLRGSLYNPVASTRLLFALLVVTVVAHALLIAAAATRHTRELTRWIAARRRRGQLRSASSHLLDLHHSSSVR
jgi:hypothetical protein